MSVGCILCDNTGWVCRIHRERPFGGHSKRADACKCKHQAQPCICNPGASFELIPEFADLLNPGSTKPQPDKPQGYKIKVH